MRFDILGWFNRFDGHGNTCVIKGRVRSGKTYLLGILARMFLNDGWAIVSNVRFDDEAFDKYAGRLFYMHNDVDFFRAYLEIEPGRKIMILFDDAQSNVGFKSTHVVRQEGDDLSTFLIFFGKLDCSLIYVAHQKYIPSFIKDDDNKPLMIYKFNRQSFIVANEIYERDTDVYRDPSAISIQVPPPTVFKGLGILSKAVARFKFDLDLQALYDYLSQWRIGENLRQGVAEFLANEAVDDELAVLLELSYEKLYMAFCLKRGRLIAETERFKDVMNSATINDARKKLRKRGLK